MDKEELLQQFLDHLRGIECVDLCYENNDCESDQQYQKAYKDDEDLIASFINTHEEE